MKRSILISIFIALSYVSLGQLSGTYTIGSSGSYSTVSAAVSALNSSGVSGPVTFNVEPGTYNEQTTWFNITGSSSTNTVTFQKDPSASGTVSIQFSGTSTDNYIWRLIGVDYLNVKNIEFKSLDTTYSSLIRFQSSTCTYVEFDSCHFENANTSASSSSGSNSSILTSSTIANNNLTIKNSSFNGGNMAVRAFGSSVIQEEAFAFTGNSVDSVAEAGLYLLYNNGFRIANNSIRCHSGSSNTVGILISQSDSGIEISGNEIILEKSSGFGRAIHMSSSKNSAANPGRIFNNLCYISGNSTTYGCEFGNCTNVQMDFNTFYATSTATAYGVHFANSTDCSVRNNIFYCGSTTSASYPFYMFNSTGFSSNTVDYNCYYSNSPNIGYHSGTRTTLAAWQSSTSADSNSIELDPNFTSTTNLRVTNDSLAGQGITISGISSDIDGVTRAAPPAIGADEIFVTPLAGSYTVGGTSPQYSTVVDAVNDLMFRGVSDSVVFKIRSGTYDGNLKISAFTGMGSANPVFFQKDDASTGDVVLTASANTSTDNYTLWLDSVSNIYLKSLKFDTSTTNFSRQLYITGISDSIGVDSVTFNAKSRLAIETGNGVGDTLSYFTLSNCSIRKKTGSGVYIGNGHWNKVLYNRIENFGQGGGNGIEFENRSNNFLEVIGNYLESDTTYQVTTNDLYGMRYNYGGDDGTFADNQIYLHAAGQRHVYGIWCRFDGVEVRNNIVSVTGQLSGNARAFTSSPTRTVKFYYNTFYLNTTDLSGNLSTNHHTFSGSGSGSANDLRNNIFVNLGGGTALGISTSTTTSDYNNIYAPTQSLSTWQTSSSMDANSVSFDPRFLEDTALVPRIPNLVSAGTAISGITTDILGNARNASTPSIGAYEHTYTCSGLAGTYTIGGFLPDYTTIQEALVDLDDRGICDDVTFNIRQGTYSDSLVIGDWYNSPDSGKVVFQADNANALDVIITGSNLGQGSSLLRLEDASSIDFIGLHFEVSASVASNTISTIRVAGDNNDISFKDCEFIGTNLYTHFMEDDTSANFYHLTMDSCRFEGTYIAIDYNFDGPGNNFTLINNHVESSNGFGIATDSNVINNNFFDLEVGNSDAIAISVVGTSHEIGNNHIVGVSETTAKGIVAQFASDVTIYNNSISLEIDVASSNSGHLMGVDYFGGGNFELYNNSIFLRHANPNASSVIGAKLQGTLNTGEYINNNVLLESSGYALQLIGTLGNFESDHNNYFTRNDTLFDVNSSYLTDLSGMLSLGLDSSSFNLDPYYVNDSTLIPNRFSLNDLGDPVSGITSDIIGTSRGSTPDIGAYEFEGVDINISVDSVRIDTLCSGTQQISIFVKNNTDTVATKIIGNINVTLIGGSQVNLGRFEVNTSLNNGDSLWIPTLSTSFLADTNYALAVEVDTINGFRDDKPDDNLVLDTFRINEQPSAVIVSALACDGDSLILSASGGSSYEWIGPNSFSDTNQTAIRTNIDASYGGTYTLVVQGGNNCFDTTAQLVSLDTVPNIGLPADTNICLGTSITVSAEVNPFHTYSWNIGESSPFITVDSASTYTLVVRDQNGCTAYDTLVIDTLSLPIVSIIDTVDLVCENGAYQLIDIALPKGGQYSSSLMKGGDTLAPLSPGFYPLTYSFTDTNGCTNSVDTSVRVYAAPAVTISPLNSLCLNSEVDTIIEHAPKGGNFFNSIAITDSLYDPGAFFSGRIDTIAYRYQAPNGCFDTAYQTITIHDTLNIVLSDTTFCENQGVATLEQAPSVYAGIFGSYSGSNALIGNVYQPAMASAAQDTLTFTVTDTNACVSSGTRVITVDTVPVVAFNDTAICFNAGLVQLNTGTPLGGAYFGNGITGDTLDPTILGLGLDTLFYTYTDMISGCKDTAASFTFINPVPTVSLNLPDSLESRCIDAIPAILSGQAPLGGDFTGAGVSSAGTQFLADSAGAGTHFITYTYTDPNGCTNSSMDSILVYDLPVVSIALDDSICVNAIPDTLRGGLPLGGFFTGNGVSVQELFDPSQVGAGIENVITYNFTDTATGCYNFARDTIRIDSLTPITLGLIPDYCINEGVDTLTQGSINTGSFSYWGKGVSNNNQYDPVLAGLGTDTILYVFTNTRGCSDSLSQVIDVHDTTAVSLNIPNFLTQLCQNDAAFTLSYGLPLGGVYNSLPAIANNQYDPANANVGTDTLIYTFTNSNNCTTSDMQEIVVNSIPVVSNLPDSFCLNDGSSVLKTGSPLGGKYTGAGMINDSIFNPLIAGTGNILLRYTYTNSSTGCSNFADTTFIVNSVPLVSLSSLSAACANKPAYNLNAGASTASFKYYSGSGITDSIAGLFDPSIAGTGNHNIHYVGVDPVSGCRDSALQNLRVDSVPMVFLDTLADLCEGAASFQLTLGNPKQNGTGIYSGQGVSGNFYYPSVSGVGTDVITYQFTDLNGCTASDTNTIVTNPLPIMTAANLSSLCLGEDSILLSGALPSGGVYTGSLFVDSTSQKFSPDSVGIWNIRYAFTDTNQCSNSINQTIRVRDLPAVSLSFPNRFCANDGVVNLSGGSPIGSSGFYKGSGVRGTNYIIDSIVGNTDTLWYGFTDVYGCSDSTFQIIEVDTLTPLQRLGLADICEGGANVDLTPFYSPSGGTVSGVAIFGNVLFSNLLTPGAYPVAYQYTDSNNCTSMLADTLYIRSNPAIVLSNDTSICDGETVTLNVSGGLAYTWGDGSRGDNIVVSPDTSTLYRVTATNGFNCSSSDEVTVTVHENFRVFTNASNAECGEQNGSGFVTVVNGKAPIQYYWSDGERNANNTGLSAGTYTITVVDDNACEQYVSLDISDGNGPKINLDSLINVNCFGESSGAIYTNISSNTNYQIQWSNGDTLASIVGLTAGLYSIQATDSSGCVGTQSFLVESADELEVSFDILNPDCDTTNGSVIAEVSGGELTYSYNWIGQSNTTDTLRQIGAGLYELEVSDGNQCVDTFSVQLNHLNGPEFRLDSLIEVNCGQNNGAIHLSSVDSIQSYQWSNSGTQDSLINLSVGTYIVTVTDTSGCKTVEEFELEYQKPMNTSLCYVTYDSASGFNQITWDTTGITGIVGYDIYRESSIKSQYNKLRSIPAGANPSFIDSSLNAHIAVGNYVIGTYDNCGNNKNIANLHKSILLTSTSVSETITQLNWTAYQGINLTGYRVFRYATDEGFRLLDTVSSATQTYIDYSTPQEQKALYYFVMARGSDQCTPEGSIVSNFSRDMGTGVFVGSQEANVDLSYRLYPNPNQGTFNIVFQAGNTQPVLMRVFSSQGEIVLEKSWPEVTARESYSIKLLDISDGIYYVQLVGNGNVTTTPVIVNR